MRKNRLRKVPHNTLEKRRVVLYSTYSSSIVRAHSWKPLGPHVSCRRLWAAVSRGRMLLLCWCWCWCWWLHTPVHDCAGVKKPSRIRGCRGSAYGGIAYHGALCQNSMRPFLLIRQAVVHSDGLPVHGKHLQLANKGEHQQIGRLRLQQCYPPATGKKRRQTDEIAGTHRGDSARLAPSFLSCMFLRCWTCHGLNRL